MNKLDSGRLGILNKKNNFIFQLENPITEFFAESSARAIVAPRKWTNGRFRPAKRLSCTQKRLFNLLLSNKFIIFNF